jgi:predicted glycogen debranching enzyme
MVGTEEVRVALERDRLCELDLALTREWLETSGSGAYASSTVLGCNTRRYHGLLVAPFAGHARRHVFLTRLEDSVHAVSAEPIVEERHEFALSMARYRGLFHPQGHRALQRFELAPFPRWVFRIGEQELTRELLLVRGETCVLVRYSLSGVGPPLELRARPLVAFREADALTFENLDLDTRVERRGAAPCAVRIRPYAALPSMSMALSAPEARFDVDPVWYRGAEYPADLARGYDGHEDGFNPGRFRARLEPGGEALFAASLADPPADLAAAWRAESERRRERVAATGARPRDRLALAADDFLYRTRERGLGVVAGFHWFAEWGRDTFISLPGLTLARGRVEECGEALLSALPHLRDGLMPNVFGRSRDDGHYGSADAALWFALACLRFERAGGDAALLRGRLAPALAEIAERYAGGTSLGIACDEGGLIRAGRADLNVTWMDARVDGAPVTPREGCAVEIEALWYSLLAHVEDIARRDGRRGDGERWRAMRERAGRTFVERFWIEPRRYLADVWNEGRRDESVRPNMVIAAALEHSPLSRAQREGVVQLAERDLLTPRGLRTLSPRDERYVGRYAGGPAERDRAYHQGTAWPWLLGFFCEAALRARGATRANVAALARILDGFDEELDRFGLNHVSEVYDGDPPHRAGGCIAQAWSAAEILRARAMLDEAAA